MSKLLKYLILLLSIQYSNISLAEVSYDRDNNIIDTIPNKPIYIISCRDKNVTVCRIYKHLKQHTIFKDYQIKAIICSIYRESTLNPKAGTAQYGLFQWNHARERLYRRVYNKSLRYTTIEEQLNFFLWELKNTEKGSYRAILSSSSFEQASVAMVKKFERSLHQQSDINKQRKISKLINI